MRRCSFCRIGPFGPPENPLIDTHNHQLSEGTRISDIIISVETIRSIEPHPQADRLEIAKVLGTQVVVPKGEYQAGDDILYFPPDMMIPADVSEVLGVQKYLKTATFEGLKIHCRVAACRLRTIACYGFIAKLPPELCIRGLGRHGASQRHRLLRRPEVRAAACHRPQQWRRQRPAAPECPDVPRVHGNPELLQVPRRHSGRTLSA